MVEERGEERMHVTAEYKWRRGLLESVTNIGTPLGRGSLQRRWRTERRPWLGRLESMLMMTVPKMMMEGRS